MESKEEYYKRLGTITDNDYSNLNSITKLVEDIIKRNIVNEESLRDLDQIIREATILTISYRDRLIKILKQTYKVD